MPEDIKGSGFVIKDKRIFAESGEVKPTDAQATPAADATKTEFPEASQSGNDKEPDYPPISFTNFVLSLSTSALFHFGDFPDQEGGKTEKNLPAAKQTIDILDMLNEKTIGNLNENEHQLIQSVLYELKLRYVKEKA
ncbi:MAG: DUF1844 domain-containing protein [Deltaproteobacteria bacterium]